MAKKGHGGGQHPEGVTPSEDDLAQVTPRDLYPTSDIRFVMVELGKLSTKIDRLISDVEKQDGRYAALDAKMGVVEKSIRDDIHKFDKTLHGFKMAVYVGGPILAAAAFVFWYLEGDRITSLLKTPPAISAPAAPSGSMPNSPAKTP